jgi:hypothetical protein
MVFCTFERQAMIAAQYIKGELELPSKEKMLQSVEEELKYNESIGYGKKIFFAIHWF